MWKELEEGGIDDKVRMGVWEKFSENIKGDTYTHTQTHILSVSVTSLKEFKEKRKKRNLREVS